jgi:hypothetical protein
MGTIYQHIETAILGAVVDISLAFLALRYLFVFLAIGGICAYFQWWIALLIYVVVLVVAFISFKQSGQGTNPTPEEEQAHQELRNNSIKFLRVPMRILTMLVSLYVSWQFVDVKPFTQTVEAKTNSQQPLQTADKTTVAEKTTISDEVKSFFGNTEPTEVTFQFKEFHQKVCNADLTDGKFPPDGKYVVSVQKTILYFNDIPATRNITYNTIVGGAIAVEPQLGYLPLKDDHYYGGLIVNKNKKNGDEIAIKNGCLKEVSLNFPKSFESLMSFSTTPAGVNEVTLIFTKK